MLLTWPRRPSAEDPLAQALALPGVDGPLGAGRVELEAAGVGEVEQLLLLGAAVGGAEEEPGEQAEGDTVPVQIIITLPAAPWSASGLMSHFASPGA